MALTTDAAVLTDLANILGQASSASLVSRFSGIVADSVQAAYLDITTALSERGYTAAQIEAWDRGEEFNRDIALYWSLIKAKVSRDEYMTINKLDRREELKTITVTIGGEVVEPETTGLVGYGDLTFDESTSRFSPNMRW